MLTTPRSSLRLLAIIVATVLAVPAALTGCKTYTSGIAGFQTEASEASVSFELAQTLWTNERGTQEGLQKAIDALKKVVASEPEHQEALILLARASYFMADAYTTVEAEPADDYA